jgi:MFS family permease
MPLRLPRLLQPLRRREFALLSLGSTASWLGDGFFFVALAWQVYRLSNTPTALSLVSLAWTLPNILFLLLGGVVSDRVDRRRVMICADLLRALTLGGIGLLSLSGHLRLWQMLVLMPFVGTGDAFFNPASTAIVPDLVPPEELAQANALSGVSRPLMTMLLGPAVGGFLVGLAGPGAAFLVDSASFLISAVSLAVIAARPIARASAPGVRRVFREMAEGWGYVRNNPWCWATQAGTAISLLAVIGPWQVIVPYIVKNDLRSGPAGLGFVYAFGGIGSILMSLRFGQAGLLRRPITLMYVTWSLGIGLIAAYAVVTELWQAMAVSLGINALLALGELIWTTLQQRLVPRTLLGRVSSLDWLLSTGLVPLSFLFTGPLVALFGARATIGVGGLLGGIVFGAFLLVPGVRDPEREVAGSPS